MSTEPVAVKQRSTSETQDKLFHQAAMKGYETEIANLKKEIEQLHETSQHEVKIATSFLNDEKDRLAKELAATSRALAQSEDVLHKKDEQIRDLSNRSIPSLADRMILFSLERDLVAAQSRVKESKKVTMREPTPTLTPPVQTQSRLAQTDPWAPPPSPPMEKSDEPVKEIQTMMQTKFESLEQKYQMVAEQKNAQIQQLMHEVQISSVYVESSPEDSN